MGIVLNRCVKCGGTEYDSTFEINGAIIGCCAKRGCYGGIIIKSSPEYEANLLKNAQAQVAAKQAPKIECPYCHSTATRKISGTSRVVSAGLFGLGSKKIGKQWHCCSCKSDF